MSVNLLKEYIAEALLVELRVDHAFLDRVHRLTGISLPGRRMYMGAPRGDYSYIAERWLDDVEDELGGPVRLGTRMQVVRFVESRMGALVKRFRGNTYAAEQTMYNLLNSRFNELKPSTR